MKNLLLIIVFVFINNLLFAQLTHSDRNILEDLRPEDVVAFSDFNNDGFNDVVKITSDNDLDCFFGNKKLVWANNDGKGAFETDHLIKEYVNTSEYVNSKIFQINTADYDNDGDVDITVSIEYDTPDPNAPSFILQRYVIEFFRNNGDGTFQMSTEIFRSNTIVNGTVAIDMLSFDFENDGDIDIAFMYLGRIYQLKHIYNGNFSAPTFSVISSQVNYSDLKAVDINSDGFKDFFAVSNRNISTGEVKILVIPNDNGIIDYSANSYKFTSVSQSVLYSVIDVDGDDRPDIITYGANPDPQIGYEYYHNNGSLGMTDHFDAKQPLPIANLPIQSSVKFKTGDFDGDGDDDIIHIGSESSLIENDNGSLVAHLLSFNPFLGNEIMECIDINTDGKIDILSKHSTWHSNNILWSTLDDNGEIILGDIIVAWGRDAMVIDEYYFLIKDVDSDGDNDMVLRSGSFYLLYQNMGNGAFLNPKLFSKKTFVYNQNFQVADFDGNGIMDLIKPISSSQTAIYYRFTDGSETVQILDKPSNYITVQDYEGDGDIDILSLGLINDGAGNFTDEGYFGNFSSQGFVYEDLNNDGILDYFTLNNNELKVYSSIDIYNYINQTIISGPNVYYVKFLDYDMNGLKDILFTTRLQYPSRNVLMISYNLGTNSFSPAQEIFVLNSNFNLPKTYFKDIDYNGYIDVVLQTYNSAVTYFLQDSDGTFGNEETLIDDELFCYIERDYVLDMIFADMDGDGVDDYIINGTLDISWLNNNFNVDIITLDYDQDGITNLEEDLNGNSNLADDDTDGDGIPNYYDSDDDGDTVQTIDETTGIGAGVAPSYVYIDTDGDTIENYLDNDDDGDGTLTIDEDYNNNGNPIDDDTNTNGIPDFLDEEVFLSMNSFAFDDLNIYPNPTSETITVQSSQMVSETTISLYDIQGKVLLTEKIIPQNGMLTMNVSSLENGVYFVKISSEGNSVVKKLLKN
ncbi:MULTISPECIES: T9SS type A sorting domain-containing protein [Aequorivita]|uniref:T9SS type A sorting domain-containing protein n=1 Tax=Aequorivita iocasae TaxID=2803865 RepID=A0ABX7DR64_9FLAO|nr:MULTISPECIES: T9SS type A sorting domain-containing protein [Aequorivita]QQX76620.1 T9SS type A sorting domain-containing protein [Aequorivita iocasae]UCA56091.1 T9SS type A sorting domain-containing protein [Aequorivita sp. F7]